MEAKKCQTCGERHWGFKCEETRQDVKKVEMAPTPFDRKAYQKNYMREYMRKKRAAEKAKT